MRQETSTVALPTSIETLLSGQVVEWGRIEFKSTWDAQASLKTICAFADLDNWAADTSSSGSASPRTQTSTLVTRCRQYPSPAED